MANTTAPHRLTIRSYQVGFGDCFLLSFDYAQSRKHVLIDFGSMKRPPNSPQTLMVDTAKAIEEHCEGKLHVVIATHRHLDHISGFRRKADGTGAGDIIRGCQPEIVLQPWTEHPDAQPDALQAPSRTAEHRFIARLHDMNTVADSVPRVLRRLDRSVPSHRLRDLRYRGKNNIKNKDCIENLMTMGRRKARYLHTGVSAGLGSILRGVKVHVLGPPNLKQTRTIETMRDTDPDEFWHLQAATTSWAMREGRVLFPDQVEEGIPVHARWFRRRLQSVWTEALLGIVRELDDELNNTSLILLFEVGGMFFLFPGDAQYENWAYALGKPEYVALLAQTDVYKVGHHGSLNATPKTLWGHFAKRDGDPAAVRMMSILSTLGGFHGHPENESEVPRGKLVTALRDDTDLASTEDLDAGPSFYELTIDF